MSVLMYRSDSARSAPLSPGSASIPATWISALRMSPESITCQSSVMAGDRVAGESGEEGAALLPAAGRLVVLGRFFVLTATEYRLPAQLAVREAPYRRD